MLPVGGCFLEANYLVYDLFRVQIDILCSSRAEVWCRSVLHEGVGIGVIAGIVNLRG